MNLSSEDADMSPVSLACVARERLRRFAVDQDGVSAVEFALLLPLMITLYLGGVEISQAVSADRKTTLVAHTIGDLISQASCISSTEMTNIFNAAKAVVYPYNTANLKAVTTRVDMDKDGKATVVWSNVLNSATPRSGDVSSLIPTTLKTPNSSLIWSEAFFTYKPTIGYVITGQLTLNDQIFLRPRLSTAVNYNNCS
jgi:Flp pilus assembly protein TadG